MTNAPTSPPDHGGLESGRLRRVLQVSFACHPELSMETRIGWLRAVHAADRHDVTVLHGDASHQELLTDHAARLGLADRLRFRPVTAGAWSRLLMGSATTYYAGYRLWQLSAWRQARRLHAERAFDLVHQVTFCGFREPGYCWRLGTPFVWGPFGGTQAFPTAYLGQLDLRSAWVEVCRNALNWWQLRFSRRVGAAVKRASVLMAATQQAADDMQRARGRRAEVRLETGLDYPIGPPREPRRAGEPLRILWAGRLRAWKTLPLLLRALPLLPRDVDWRLRVLGVGSSEKSWKRLADRLGVADRIEWLGWPEYRQTLPHYRWADAYAFTSMRDTSGTGLLEALAAGTPIVGVDHQGAADIMTTDCALPTPVGRPRDTINGFATALAGLARDPELWSRLSEGARRRAGDFVWDDQADLLAEWYETACAAAAPQAERPARSTPRKKHATAGSESHPYRRSSLV